MSEWKIILAIALGILGLLCIVKLVEVNIALFFTKFAFSIFKSGISFIFGFLLMLGLIVYLGCKYK